MLTFLNGALLFDDQNAMQSSLERDLCPSCTERFCSFSCDGSQGADENCEETDEEVIERLVLNSVLDAVESLLLALVTSGVITQNEDPRVNEAIQTTLDTCAFHFLDNDQ